jgi:hypothetical protein
MSTNRLTEADRKQIIDAYLGGSTSLEIGNFLGVVKQ